MKSIFITKLALINNNSLSNYSLNLSTSKNYKNTVSNRIIYKPKLSKLKKNISNSIKFNKKKTRNYFLQKNQINNSNEIQKYIFKGKNTFSFDSFIDTKLKTNYTKMKKLESNSKINMSKIKIKTFNSLQINSLDSERKIFSNINSDNLTFNHRNTLDNYYIPLKKKINLINLFKETKLNIRHCQSQNEILEKKNLQSTHYETNNSNEKKKKNSFIEKDKNKKCNVKDNILQNKIKMILNNSNKITNFNDILLMNELNFKKRKNLKIRKIKKYNEKLIKYFSSELIFPNSKHQKIIKKSKKLIKKKIFNQTNNLSVKNPYVETKNFLQKMKIEFIQNNKEEIMNEFICLFNEKYRRENIENIVNKKYADYLISKYFNFIKEFLHYLFYGEKPIKNKNKIVFTRKSKVEPYKHKLNIKNLIFINQFFLYDHFTFSRIKIQKTNKQFLTKSTRKFNKIASLFSKKKETKIQKINKQIYNFKRITNKLDNFSILKIKDNFFRKDNFVKPKKSLVKKYLNSEKLFKSLTYLIYKNLDDSFKKLFEEYKDFMNLEETDEKKNTLLILSVKFNNFKVFKFLIEKGANINTQNIYLNTPLHYAFANKYYKFVDYLINKGADENIENIYGKKYFDM